MKHDLYLLLVGSFRLFVLDDLLEQGVSKNSLCSEEGGRSKNISPYPKFKRWSICKYVFNLSPALHLLVLAYIGSPTHCLTSPCGYALLVVALIEFS